MNQIILSCNENPIYSSFWPPVASAYRMMFPQADIHLAFLTNRSEDDELVRQFRTFGKVTLFPIIEGIPEFAQAKMIRFILASQQGSDVCYIDDIDLYPLVKSFITDKTDKRPENTLLCVGGEVYHHNGCYPISQMTAEGDVWKSFINPKGLDYSDLMASWLGETKFDRRENMQIVLDWDKDDYFSDERLLRRLIHFNPVPKIEMVRGYNGSSIYTIMESTLDRFDWKLDPYLRSTIGYMDALWKLNHHGYFNAHCCRPFRIEEMQPLVDYIRENYP